MKKPKCKYCGGQHWTYQCWSKPKPIPKARKTKIKTTSDSERRKLIKDLDKYYSLYIRWKYADKNGYDTCYTCGRKLLVPEAQCGHYVSRRWLGTRWEEQNMRPQCQVCNMYKNGNYKVYEPKMKKELGIDEVQKLWDKAYSGKKLTTYELGEMLTEVKNKYKALVADRQSKGWRF